MKLSKIVISIPKILYLTATVLLSSCGSNEANNDSISTTENAANSVSRSTETESNNAQISDNMNSSIENIQSSDSERLAQSNEAQSQTSTNNQQDLQKNNDSSVESIAKVSMADLNISEDFTFTTKAEVLLIVDLPIYKEQRAQISLYQNYQQLENLSFHPDSNSKILSGALKNGAFEQVFYALNNQERYLLEVWFYNKKPPLQKELVLTNYELHWR